MRDDDHARHAALHAKFLEGHQWLYFRRLRWWYKPWTWLRPPGEWIDPAPALRAHLQMHRELVVRSIVDPFMLSAAAFKSSESATAAEIRERSR